MKNKLEINYLTSERFVGDQPMNVADQLAVQKKNARRKSVTPKIVVCPPMEEVAKQMPTPRGGRLLRALVNRLSRKATDSESVISSSSSDSVSGEQGRVDDRSSLSVSESSSDGSERHRRHRSAVSLRRVFQSLTTLTSRSQSCSPTERSRPPKKQSQPQRILRPPVTYTYVRGLSGLPTQRVPRNRVCCASLGLNR